MPAKWTSNLRATFTKSSFTNSFTVSNKVPHHLPPFLFPPLVPFSSFLPQSHSLSSPLPQHPSPLRLILPGSSTALKRNQEPKSGSPRIFLPAASLCADASASAETACRSLPETTQIQSCCSLVSPKAKESRRPPKSVIWATNPNRSGKLRQDQMEPPIASDQRWR